MDAKIEELKTQMRIHKVRGLKNVNESTYEQYNQLVQDKINGVVKPKKISKTQEQLNLVLEQLLEIRQEIKAINQQKKFQDQSTQSETQSEKIIDIVVCDSSFGSLSYEAQIEEVFCDNIAPICEQIICESKLELEETVCEQKSELDQILDIVKTKTSDISIQAFAGCGKTHTLKRISTQLQDKKILYLVFNKKNQTEASECPEFKNCEVMTFNGLGQQIIKNKQVNEYKVTQQYINNTKFSYKFYQKPIKQLILKTVNVCKYMDISPNQFEQIQAKFNEQQALFKAKNIYVGMDEQKKVEFQKCVQFFLQTSLTSNFISFDDQLYLLTQTDVQLPSFSHILVDESQDLNQCQINIIKRFKQEQNSRVVFVGDKYQSIYQFRGSTSDSIKLMKNMLSEFGQVQVCKLTTNYRSYEEIIAYTQKQFNDDRFAKFKSNSNESGSVQEVSVFTKEMLSQDDFAILSKTNNECLQHCLNVQNMGLTVKYDIKPLLMKFHKNLKLDGLVSELTKIDLDSVDTSFENEQIEPSLLQHLLIKHGDLTVQEFLDELNSENGVQIMTIHKSKGLEFNNVFLFFRYVDYQSQQEQNLHYVGITRAKHNLYI